MPAETFDTQDAIPEELRAAAFETKDGKFVVVRDEDTAGLKSALEKERAARKDEEKRAKDAAKRLADLELQAKATKEGLTGEKLAEIRQQVAAEFEPFKAEAERLKSEVRTLRLDNTVKSLFAKAEFIDVDAAFKLFGDEFDLTDDGQPIVKAAPGTALEKHIAALAQRAPYLVKGSAANGGGAGGTRTGEPPMGASKPSKMTNEQIRTYVDTHGNEAFQKLVDAEMLENMRQRPKAA